MVDAKAILEAAFRSTGDGALRGRVELPQPIKTRATDAPCVDPASFCTTFWSSMLPQGYATARRRSDSSYDADVL
eukprot:3668322-Prymnesium_polylepis.1